MKIKRITCLILAALLIIATLGACKDKKENDGSTQDGSHVSADVFSKEKVEYKDADGDSKYNIVRSAEADSVVSGLATDLFKRIKTEIGVSPKNIADDAADGADSYEILIGDTNRAESRQASDYFNENYKCYSGSYFICTIGKKIVILGVGNSSVVAANCHAWPTSLGEEHGLVHTSLDESYKNDKKYYCPDNGKFGDTFHTYGMLWDSTQMSFFCDGKIYFSYDITQKQEDIMAFNKKMYLILSAAIGFKSSGYNISNTTDEQWANTSKLLVDNLYIYQMDDGKSEIYLR